jgi:hypothetical protein
VGQSKEHVKRQECGCLAAGRDVVRHIAVEALPTEAQVTEGNSELGGGYRK